MAIADWLMVAAVLVAPLVGIQLSQLLERRRDWRQRRLAVFRTLMTTRKSRMAADHIQALNMIDVEFDGKDKKSRTVVDAWKAYLDHLNDSSASPEVWGARGDDLFVDLLYAIAIALGYDFDKTHLRRASYYPRGYGEAEGDAQNIRRGFREVLEGKRWIPIWLGGTQPVTPHQELSTPQELSKSQDAQPQQHEAPRAATTKSGES
jgi:hypothetical protein